MPVLLPAGRTASRGLMYMLTPRSRQPLGYWPRWPRTGVRTPAGILLLGCRRRRYSTSSAHLGNQGVTTLISPPHEPRPARHVRRDHGWKPGLQRQPDNSPRTPLVQRDRTPAGEKFEIKAWKIKTARERVEISGRFSVARKGATFVEAPTDAPGGAGKAKWSLIENKTSIEQGAGRWGAKLSSALAKWDWSGPIPGFEYLKVGFGAKALEGKFDLVKKEADLDVLKVAVTLNGNVAPLLQYAGMGHLADRVEIKAELKAEVGISPRDLARLKTAFRAKEELKAATKAVGKRAREYGRAADELKRLKHRREKITITLNKRLRDRERLQKQLAEMEKKPHKLKGRARRRARNLRRRLNRLDGTVKHWEKKLAGNTDKARKQLSRAKKARKGLGEAGQTLQKAGRRLDDALKGVTGKLGKAGRKAVDKATKKIMKRLGKTLAKKVIAKLIPGLNVVSTVMDIVEVGGALWDLATGKRKFGLPLEDEVGEGGGGEDGGTGGGTPDSGTGADAGADAGTDADADAGTGAGTGHGGTGDAGTGDAAGGDGGTGTGQESIEVDPAVRTVLETIAQANLDIDPMDAEILNQLIPRDITPEELEELQRRFGAGMAGSFDPYDVAAQIQSELDDIRAGGTTVTVDGREVDVDLQEAAEPPRTLLPATRTDVRTSSPTTRRPVRW